MESQETQRGGINSWLGRKWCLDQVFLFFFSNMCWSRADGAELHFCRDVAQVLRAVAREGTDEPLAALWLLLSVGCTRLGTQHRRAAALPGALPAGKPDSTRRVALASGAGHKQELLVLPQLTWGLTAPTAHRASLEKCRPGAQLCYYPLEFPEKLPTITG